ncbi:MAG: cupin domain-containing protein [Thaumarchaeota archaeon]|nr:MAG: cupin domain-containing protein [Nitrososphaerota archaeon]
MNKEAARLVKKLGLEKHPEGGYFKQTYRSDTVGALCDRESSYQNVSAA